MRRTLRFVLASLVLAASLLAQQPVARVDGRVLGPDGLPMPNVEVLAKARYQDDAILAKTRSDGDGMFVISRMPDDRGLSITAQAPGHTLSVAWAELSPEQPFAGVELRLYEANTLRGRIVDPEGRPVAGASVLGCKDMTWFHGQTMPVETTSDADGRFELRGVPIGDCVVRAYASGFALREYWLTALVDSEIEMPPLLREDGTTLSIAVLAFRRRKPRRPACTSTRRATAPASRCRSASNGRCSLPTARVASPACPTPSGTSSRRCPA